LEQLQLTIINEQLARRREGALSGGKKPAGASRARDDRKDIGLVQQLG
jgi:hypothetical protein